MAVTRVFSSPPVAGRPDTTLRQGAAGPIVEELQRKLGLAVDGKFGPATLEAVRRFQEANGLSSDGAVGAATWAKLALTSPPPASNPDQPPAASEPRPTNNTTRPPAPPPRPDTFTVPREPPASREGISADLLAEFDAYRGIATDDERIRALPRSVQLNVLEEVERHPANPDAARVVAYLARERGFALLPEKTANTLVNLLGGTNEVSRHARAQFDRLSSRQEFIKATDAEQARQIQQFFADPKSLPDITSDPPILPGRPDVPRITGPRDVPAHGFQGGAAPAREYLVEVGQTTTPVFVTTQAVQAGLFQHSLQEIAKGLGATPLETRKAIRQITIEPKTSRLDDHWHKTYGEAFKGSYMEVTFAGDVFVFPTKERRAKDEIQKALVHEVGHIQSGQLLGQNYDSAEWRRWDAAIASDGVAVSQYARTSKTEDFSETVTAFYAARGTPKERELRALMPARYALLRHHGVLS